ncbi:hypothetical protein U1Q18_028389, partial [Sarracenia purpurea var. burkii]
PNKARWSQAAEKLKWEGFFGCRRWSSAEKRLWFSFIYLNRNHSEGNKQGAPGGVAEVIRGFLESTTSDSQQRAAVLG